jgi:hypothetical protein
MIVTSSTIEIDFLKSDLVRSTGVHASDIYGDLYKRLYPKRYDFGDEPPNGVLMALGTAWEVQLEKLLVLNGVQAYRPGEMISPNGVAYSPDLIVFNSHVRVGEIKLTSMSIDDIPIGPANGLNPKFDKYLDQMRLYAYWLELRHGWLAIVSIRQPWAPVFRALDLEFSVRELDDCHKKMMSHARHEKLL